MPAVAAPSVLYVAADLTVMEVGADELLLGLAQDLSQRDEGDVLRAYRRLDLDWYRWLYHAMKRAEKATAEGRIPAGSWDTMCRRFKTVWYWLRIQHSLEEIAQAEASYPDARYLPPEVRGALIVPMDSSPWVTPQERGLHFNQWNYRARMELARRGALRLKDLGIITEADGSYSVPKGMTYSEVIKVAEQVVSVIVADMAGAA